VISQWKYKVYGLLGVFLEFSVQVEAGLVITVDSQKQICITSVAPVEARIDDEITIIQVFHISKVGYNLEYVSNFHLYA
jgi:hypothetical protein